MNSATGVAGGRIAPPSVPSSSSEIAPVTGSNVDRVLLKNFIEMVPLVESLMDRRAKSSFTRRASMVYTPAPQLKKASNIRSEKTVSAKKRRDNGSGAQQSVEGFSNFLSREAENFQKDGFELTLLREQVDNLQRQLLEKEEALKSAEDSVKQMRAAHASVDELKNQLAEKETFLKSANSELYNAKINLADKQAALEKLNWEAKMSNRKVEELQDESVSMNLEVTALMQIFKELSKNSSASFPQNTSFQCFEPLPPIDQLDEIGMMKMEEARIRYMAAVAAMKENPSDESLAIAAEARQSLEAFVF